MSVWWLFLCCRWHSPRQSLCKAPAVLPVTNWISLLFFHSWTCWCMRSLHITFRKISRDVEEVQGGPSSLCTVSHIRQGNSKTKSSEIMLTCILYLSLALMFNTLIILYPVNEPTSVMFYFFLPVCIQIWVKLPKFEIFCRNRKVLWKCRNMNLTRCEFVHVY